MLDTIPMKKDHHFKSPSIITTSSFSLSQGSSMKGPSKHTVIPIGDKTPFNRIWTKTWRFFLVTAMCSKILMEVCQTPEEFSALIMKN